MKKCIIILILMFGPMVANTKTMTVSLLELIKSPEKFSNSTIQVEGLLDLHSSYPRLYIPTDFNESQGKSLELVLDQNTLMKKEKYGDNQIVIIEGMFIAYDTNLISVDKPPFFGFLSKVKIYGVTFNPILNDKIILLSEEEPRSRKIKKLAENLSEKIKNNKYDEVLDLLLNDLSQTEKTTFIQESKHEPTRLDWIVFKGEESIYSRLNSKYDYNLVIFAVKPDLPKSSVTESLACYLEKSETYKINYSQLINLNPTALGVKSFCYLYLSTKGKEDYEIYIEE